jgi:two-component system, sporulation sensor kinase D
MSLYSTKQRWKIFLLISALLIIGVSMWYSNHIVQKVGDEERQKVVLWAEAIEKRASLVSYTQDLFEELALNEQKKVSLWSEAMRVITNEELDDYTFITRVIQDNTTIPMIVVDEKDQIIFWRNITGTDVKEEQLKVELAEMKTLYEPLKVQIVEGETQYLYYKDSRLFSDLRGVMDDLINSFISETVINSASVPVILTNANRDSVLKAGNVDPKRLADPSGLQALLEDMESMNTPLKVELGGEDVNYIFYEDSLVLRQLQYFPFIQFIVIGLFLFIAYLLFSTFRKAEQNQVWVGLAKETISELNKDVGRLETIADRFSKIGSKPDLQQEDVKELLEETVNYLTPRISNKVKIEFIAPDGPVHAMMNRPLFSWVIENLSKNAIDAMKGEGNLTINVTDEVKQVVIDITDSGTGIPSKLHKTIFQPGYTTKKRGWGLGLSLTKRIIENYHVGRIFVKRSEIGKGTTFRILIFR